MNLNEINTVGEFILENEKQVSPFQKVLQALSHKDITPKDQLLICKAIVHRLVNFHEYVVEEKANLSPAWYVDLQTLTFIEKMLSTVE